jgi:hypothetical protein
MASTKPSRVRVTKPVAAAAVNAPGAIDPDQEMTALGHFQLAARDILRRDTKGRVTLGKLGIEGDGFRVYVNDLGQILLDPIVALPAREQWLFKNPERAKALDRALAQSAAGEVVALPSFAHMLEDDDA